MTNCRPAGDPETTARPHPPGDDRRPLRDDPGAPPRRRFRDLLDRGPRPATRPADAGPDADALRLAATAARAAEREYAAGHGSPPATGPAAPTPALPDIGLDGVQVATGRHDAWLRFTIDEGDFAGLRMAFSLRGDVLDVTLDAPAVGPLERIRAREHDVREALAARGITLERFDADEGNGRDRHARDEREGDERDGTG
ncbi:MAG: hypothetical protein HY907_04525 [Deltaproteobacteria bacterium]|nr:hypothetical protein [Deltaproteobacteria bacterium]